jgi:DNA helicase HerA-like ATPase
MRKKNLSPTPTRSVGKASSMFQTTDCIAILGTRGTGKTTLSRKVQGAWPRQVIIDPVDEYSDGIIVSDFSDFSKKMLEFQREKIKKFRIIFRFSPEVEDQAALANAILRVCFEFGNIQIVMEEVQLYSSTHQLPLFMRNALFMGRHKGLSLVFVTQRPGALNKNILSQCQHVFAGHIHEKNDVDYLRSIFHEQTDKLLNMPRGKFLYYSPRNPITVVDNGG